jgi:hypothetical protein
MTYPAATRVQLATTRKRNRMDRNLARLQLVLVLVVVVTFLVTLGYVLVDLINR